MYHRVVELPSDPQLMCVSPRHFAEHMEVLRKYARPVPLQYLAQQLRNDLLPPRSVVVTLDDGYADNLFNARPVLEGCGVPASVFVTAGHLENRVEFWWDELDRLLLQPGTLPTDLHVTLRGRTHRWLMDGAANYTDDASQRDGDWHIERSDDPSPRHYAYRSLYRLLHGASPRDRQLMLDQLRRQARATCTPRTSHRTLTTDELTQLSSSPLISIGSHTVTHPVLARLTPSEQRSEIQGSKDFLEAIVGKPIASFAYPHGSWTAATVGIVRDAQFSCACSSQSDAVWANANRFQLPRIVVRDWDGDTFGRHLSSWFRG
jgi:peptidoglycan/xylan/chitin deacetylase (PgdA/CDA1 family)